MRHWRKMLASLIVFGPVIVLVAIYFCLWTGRVEIQNGNIDITNEAIVPAIERKDVEIKMTDVKTKEKIVIPIIVHNTSLLRSGKIADVEFAC